MTERPYFIPPPEVYDPTANSPEMNPREPGLVERLWASMLQAAPRAGPAQRQYLEAPQGAVAREPSPTVQNIDRQNSLARQAQMLPMPRAAPVPAERATMARRGRSRVANENMRQQYGGGAQAVQRHMTQADREAAGTPRAPLPREARPILDLISEFEGTSRYGNRGYNTLVGGSQVEDLSRHPRSVGVTTSDGPSRAFGRYQFIPGTWDQAASALGLTDMSPDSQDRAAWWLASRLYRAQTGRELGQDVSDQSRWDSIAHALGGPGGWASFPAASRWHTQRSHGLDEFRNRLQQFLGTAVQEQPRTASEFIGIDPGFRAAPRARRQPRRRFEDFVTRRRNSGAAE